MSSQPQATENTYEFVLVVAPGFEILAEKEISRFTLTPVSRERGGLTVHLPLAEGLELNRVLRIPTRILLRLASFGCRDFPKLFKKMVGFPWAEWVAGPVEFVASTHKSRLFIKKRIEKACEDGFAKAQKAGSAPIDGEPSTVYVRFVDDICFVSLDTSGELLHRRGVKTMTSEAPLRETIAAAMLAFMGEPPEGTVLVDPMVGTGTFFFEAANVESKRDYAFETIPKYIEEKTTVSSPPSPQTSNVDGNTNGNGNIKRPTFSRFVGFEIDPKTASAARENLKSIGAPVAIEVADIFDAKPLAGNETRWLIANPPYGERLKIEGRLKDYYELLFASCERIVKPKKACFVLPDSSRPEKLRAPNNWRLESLLKFQNGGLPVTALLFVCKET
jgi:putative N6-adenine-specific DNA methylase